MTDIHTHILPGVDDGAADPGQSLRLLKSLEMQGVDTAVLTPHYYGRGHGVEKFLAMRGRAFESLTKEYGGPVKLILGAECNISTAANCDYTDFYPLCIADTSFLLTELSFERKWRADLWERIDRVLNAGMTPIVAHAELYPAVIKSVKTAAELANCGCKIQINCSSVTDEKLYNKIVRKMIEKGIVSFLGTDTHNETTRPPKYSEAVEILTRDYGESFVNSLNRF